MGSNSVLFVFLISYNILLQKGIHTCARRMHIFASDYLFPQFQDSILRFLQFYKLDLSFNNIPDSYGLCIYICLCDCFHECMILIKISIHIYEEKYIICICTWMRVRVCICIYMLTDTSISAKVYKLPSLCTNIHA